MLRDTANNLQTLNLKKCKSLNPNLKTSLKDHTENPDEKTMQTFANLADLETCRKMGNNCIQKNKL